MSPPGPAGTLRGNSAPLNTKASGENHGPRAAGRIPAENVSDRPAEARQGSGAPWGMKAGTGEPSLWAEDQLQWADRSWRPIA